MSKKYQEAGKILDRLANSENDGTVFKVGGADVWVDPRGLVNFHIVIDGKEKRLIVENLAIVFSIIHNLLTFGVWVTYGDKYKFFPGTIAEFEV